MVYQSCQAIATEPQLAETKPNQLWQSIAQFIDDNAPNDEKQRKMMLKHFYKEGYKSRRTTIARAAAKLHRAKMMKGAEGQEDGARKILRIKS
ncbi:hypothetical protein TELCIR_08786 [Teladorsagia circumcincta]|uniref:Uncharacterized protein n=1 Tax=Teladorsagia circumcincta TaxID=45464 RepID=A0A2G9UI32_TELCI|nr:hypothetical protein TELCIR_08786 [Teladorsagia circumcincta]